MSLSEKVNKVPRGFFLPLEDLGRCLVLHPCLSNQVFKCIIADLFGLVEWGDGAY